MNIRRCILMFFVLACIAFPGAGCSTTGVWQCSASNGMGGVMNLQQSGNTITGDGSVFPGASGSITGKIDGNRITLTGVAGLYRLYLSGTWRGDTMSGKWTDSFGSSGTWDAVRQ